ncbi:MAG: hypothetical protein K2G36_08155 [Ruminococcus sp.]|nr:hypothetical protein [Ruminococcus sp.]
MKLFRHLLSFITVITVTVNVVSLDTSAITEIPVNYTESTQPAYFEDVGSVSEYIKENLVARNETIEFLLPAGSDGIGTADSAVDMAFAETDKSNHGDYLRKSIKQVNYRTRSSYKEVKVTVTVSYRTNAEQENYIEEKISEILDGLDVEGKNDYRKITAIYEYIINNVTYDYTSGSELKYTAYGALHDGTAVCQGISMLFYRMLKESGISCRMITGSAGGPHAWNIAGIDGVYYLFDPTFDVNFSNISDCHYFMLGSEDFDSGKSVTHVPDSSDDNTLGFIDYTAESFTETYPISDGKFAVNNRAGDVNNDGFIDAVDASLVLEAYAELSTDGASNFTTIQEIVSDVNDDGEVNAVDSSFLLQYYAYTSTMTTGEKPEEPEIFFAKEMI